MNAEFETLTPFRLLTPPAGTLKLPTLLKRLDTYISYTVKKNKNKPKQTKHTHTRTQHNPVIRLPIIRGELSCALLSPEINVS